jgi:hypothetical protein
MRNGQRSYQRFTAICHTSPTPETLIKLTDQYVRQLSVYMGLAKQRMQSGRTKLHPYEKGSGDYIVQNNSSKFSKCVEKKGSD